MSQILLDCSYKMNINRTITGMNKFSEELKFENLISIPNANIKKFKNTQLQ